MYQTFLKNLEQFKKYEIESIRRTKEHFNINENEEINLNDNYKYDFEIKSLNLFFEVKTDYKSLKTNNIFIEFENTYNKPKKSGINATISDYYIINDTIKYYLIEVSKFKKMILDNDYILICYNYTKTARGYLFNKDVIINNSIEI